MIGTPLSQTLRERNRPERETDDGSCFMRDLMTGAGTRADYIALVTQYYVIYRALEHAATVFAQDPIAAAFISTQLTRLPALEHDLEFLLGDSWREQVHPLPTSARYIRRIKKITAQGWAGGFIAHHYTRYLGDLSGGHTIGRLMQRHFGFETNGIGFYLFDQIASPRAFKETYRNQLDAVSWDDDERERVIAEVLTAYTFNTELFLDLTRTRTAA